MTADPAAPTEPTAPPARPGRVLIFIVAYNAETTIAQVLTRIPPEVLAYDYEILIVDDQSRDATFERATAFRNANNDINLTVLFNPENQGYGGNQKIGYQYAIMNNFEVVVLLHGDGQYAPEVMDELIRPLLAGEAEAVFGSRMAEDGAARKGGMPLYKYFGNRILTTFENRLLGMELSEFHSGYRAYSVQALAAVPFRFNTNDFHFDTEIIIQFKLAGKRIREVAIPTYYGNEICHVNGIKYAWDVVKAVVRAKLQGLQVCYARQFDIVAPEERYPLKLGFLSSHTAAIAEVKSSSRVLDLGCGEGYLGRELEKKGCVVTGMDAAPCEGICVLKDFQKIDLDREEIPVEVASYDYLLLLDVIEHLDTLRQYDLLDEIRAKAAGRGLTLILTTPNVAFVLIRLQLLLGKFNYGRRGILDHTHRRLFTFASLRHHLEQCGYTLEKEAGIPVPAPAAVGDNFLGRLLLKINKALIWLWPGMFAYQIFIRATPRPTVTQLLENAHAASARRRESLPDSE